MALRLNYTSKEFLTILTEIKNALTSELPESNDFLESNVGRWLIDTYAAIADQIAFNIDRQAAECYVDRAEIRSNLMGLLKLIGFQPFNPIPDQVLVAFTVQQSPINSIVVPARTVVTASNRKIPFATMSQVLIPGTPYWQPGTAYVLGDKTRPTASDNPHFQVTGTIGANPLSGGIQPTWPSNLGATVIDGSIIWTAVPPTMTVSIPCQQGEWRTANFVSTGTKGQRYLLNSNSIAEGQITVSVQGAAWENATDNVIVGSSQNDTVFKYINLPDQRVIVEFGDGVEGVSPPKGADISISYFNTLHINGRVQSGEIDTLGSVLGPPIVVTNERASTGSSDFESIASARFRYPTAFKSLRRAVTIADYEAIARLVPGVLQAKAADLNTDSEIPFCKVIVYVIGNGGLISDSLNSTVTDFLNLRRTLATVLEVRSPTAVPVDVTGTIKIVRNADPTTVLASVNTVIGDYFELLSTSDSPVKIGANVAIDPLAASILHVDGVALVDISWSVNGDPARLDQGGNILVNYYEYGKLNSSTVSVAGVV